MKFSFFHRNSRDKSNSKMSKSLRQKRVLLPNYLLPLIEVFQNKLYAEFKTNEGLSFYSEQELFDKSTMCYRFSDEVEFKRQSLIQLLGSSKLSEQQKDIFRAHITEINLEAKLRSCQQRFIELSESDEARDKLQEDINLLQVALADQYLQLSGLYSQSSEISGNLRVATVEEAKAGTIGTEYLGKYLSIQNDYEINTHRKNLPLTKYNTNTRLAERFWEMSRRYSSSNLNDSSREIVNILSTISCLNAAASCLRRGSKKQKKQYAELAENFILLAQKYRMQDIKDHRIQDALVMASYYVEKAEAKKRALLGKKIALLRRKISQRKGAKPVRELRKATRGQFDIKRFLGLLLSSSIIANYLLANNDSAQALTAMREYWGNMFAKQDTNELVRLHQGCYDHSLILLKTFVYIMNQSKHEDVDSLYALSGFYKLTDGFMLVLYQELLRRDIEMPEIQFNMMTDVEQSEVPFRYSHAVEKTLAKVLKGKLSFMEKSPIQNDKDELPPEANIGLHKSSSSMVL